MSTTSQPNCSHISHFLLSRIPYLEDFNLWLGILFISMYIVAVMGNSSILYIIQMNQELHGPMYIFLFMLSVLDLLIATNTMPRMLGIFWTDDREIPFSNCLTQMFFIHFFSTLESGILLAMAVDRYVAICHPLRYSSILTNERIGMMSALIVGRGALVMLPLPFIINRFPEWKDNVLSHSYCLHQEIMKLACGDITVNIIYGLFINILVMGIDSLFISHSYVLIIKTVHGLVEDASMKAFSTCTAHICAVLIFYIPLLGVAVVHRFQNPTAPNLHILFGNVYLLVPPVTNPLIYGIKTNQIRIGFKKAYDKIIHQVKTSKSI